MPRFSQQEREKIHANLLTQGERLFITHGIKKVTIDDLVNAVGIAKASFYIFYQSKEYLYLDIVQSLQRDVFNKMDAVLQGNAGLPGRLRVAQVFKSMYQVLSQYPLLGGIDTATAELIARKVSAERLSDFYAKNIDAVQVMHRHGINFLCPLDQASCAFQALYHGWLYLKDKDPALQASVTNIMLEAVIEKIVVD